MTTESNRHEQPYPHDDERLSAYLDGELSAPEQAQLEARLVVDAPLRQLVDELRAVRQQLEVLPEYKLGPDFAAKVLARTEQQFFLEQTPSTSSTVTKITPPESTSEIQAETSVISGEKPILLTKTTQPNWRRPVIWSMIASAAAILLLLTNRGRDPETMDVAHVKVIDNTKNTNEQIEKKANRIPEMTKPETQRLDQLQLERRSEEESLHAKPSASADPDISLQAPPGAAKPLAKVMNQPTATAGDQANTKDRALNESAKSTEQGNKFSATIEANDYSLTEQDQRRNDSLRDEYSQLPVLVLTNSSDPQQQSRYKSLIAQRTQIANTATWDRWYQQGAVALAPAAKQQVLAAPQAPSVQEYSDKQAAGRKGVSDVGNARNTGETRLENLSKSKAAKKPADQSRESEVAQDSTWRYLVLDGDSDQVDALVAELQTLSQNNDQVAVADNRKLKETEEMQRDKSAVRDSIPAISAYFFSDVELPNDLRQQVAAITGKSENRFYDQQSTLQSANSLELHLKSEQASPAESSAATAPPSLALGGMAAKPAEAQPATDKAATPAIVAGASGPAPTSAAPLHNEAITNGTASFGAPANKPKEAAAEPMAPAAPAISADTKSIADAKATTEPSARMMQRSSNVPGLNDPQSPADGVSQSTQASGVQPPPAPTVAAPASKFADPQLGVARKQSEKSKEQDSTAALGTMRGQEQAKSEFSPAPARRKRVLLVFQAPAIAAPSAGAGLPAAPETAQPTDSAPAKPAKE